MTTVPAATADRQLTDVALVHSPTTATVHVAAGHPRRVLCSTVIRELQLWDGQPMRTCRTCARLAVPSKARGPWWKPQPLELAAVHLAHAWSINAGAASIVARIRTEALRDGSGLHPASALDQYRAARGLAADAHDSTLLAAVLHHAAPRPAPTVADDHATALAEHDQELRWEAMRTRHRDRIRDLREARDAARRNPR